MHIAHNDLTADIKPRGERGGAHGAFCTAQDLQYSCSSLFSIHERNPSCRKSYLGITFTAGQKVTFRLQEKYITK